MPLKLEAEREAESPAVVEGVGYFSEGRIGKAGHSFGELRGGRRRSAGT